MRGEAGKVEQNESHVDQVQPSLLHGYRRTILAYYFSNKDGPCFLSKIMRFGVAEEEDFWGKKR